MALAFCAWLTMSALIACPFLQAELSAGKHPCCPRTNTPPHCPLTQSIQGCPFYVTESKIGVIESVQLDAITLPVVSNLLAPQVHEVERFLTDRVSHDSNLLLRIHVLRI